VLANGAVVGRIFKVHAAPVGMPSMWTLAFALSPASLLMVWSGLWSNPLVACFPETNLPPMPPRVRGVWKLHEEEANCLAVSFKGSASTSTWCPSILYDGDPNWYGNLASR
jgi:hypothetical protein